MLTISGVSESIEDLEFSYTGGGNAKLYDYFTNSLVVSLKIAHIPNHAI